MCVAGGKSLEEKVVQNSEKESDDIDIWNSEII